MPSRGLCRDRNSGDSLTIIRPDERVDLYITIHL